MRRTLPLLVLCLVAGLPAAPARAAEAYDNCTGFIDSVPATITTQGTWCLRKDVATSIAAGAAITINTNNVILDCNDFKLGGLSAGAGTQTSGILAVGRSSIVVRGCNLRGFQVGINLSGQASSGHLVEGNRLSGSRLYGILVEGAASLVRDNQLLDTGDSPTEAQGIGILSFGADVMDNIVDGVRGRLGDVSSQAIGIATVNSPGTRVARNRVGGLWSDFGNSSQGIAVLNSGNVVVQDNAVFATGPQDGTAIYCTPMTTVGLARGNSVNAGASGFTNGIGMGCNDGGGNSLF